MYRQGETELNSTRTLLSTERHNAKMYVIENIDATKDLI